MTDVFAGILNLTILQFQTKRIVFVFIPPSLLRTYQICYVDLETMGRMKMFLNVSLEVLVGVMTIIKDEVRGAASDGEYSGRNQVDAGPNAYLLYTDYRSPTNLISSRKCLLPYTTRYSG